MRQLTAAPMAPSGQKPLIDAAANGTPIVLIAPPSKAGVSRNQYDQFNVGPKGLILNNSTGDVQTPDGGWITGNLQLGPTPARIILNEVTGANASQLKAPSRSAARRPTSSSPTRTASPATAAASSIPTAPPSPPACAIRRRGRHHRLRCSPGPDQGRPERLERHRAATARPLRARHRDRRRGLVAEPAGRHRRQPGGVRQRSVPCRNPRAGRHGRGAALRHRHQGPGRHVRRPDLPDRHGKRPGRQQHSAAPRRWRATWCCRPMAT